MMLIDLLADSMVRDEELLSDRWRSTGTGSITPTGDVHIMIMIKLENKFTLKRYDKAKS